MSTEADRGARTGAVLAGRYRLERLLTGGGRPARLWRGNDTVLQRAVAVKIIDQDDPAAGELLTAALCSGRAAHRCLAKVFDASSDERHTYIVGEWVDGQPLHRLLRGEEVLAPTRAAHLIGTAAAAVATAHANDVLHGNLHPANLLVTGDGEVRLTDLRGSGSQEADVRALGALLYAGLTGRWPAEPATADGLPPCPQYDGRAATPRQVRAGVPSRLSELTMRAMAEDEELTAQQLADELSRHADDPTTGRLPIIEDPAGPARARWARYGIPVAALVLIAVIGIIVGLNMRVLPGQRGLSYPSFTSGGGGATASAAPKTGAITPRSASILDPQGDGTELAGAGNAIDGRTSTGWQTQDYTSADFGGLKAGMGVLVDLGRVTTVGSVTVQLADAGARVELRAADSRGTVATDYAIRGTDSDAGTTVRLTPSGDSAARYWLVWITRLPVNSDGAYTADVREISFRR